MISTLALFRHLPLTLVATCSAALLAIACARTEPITEDSGGAALMRNLLRAGKVDIVVPHGSAEEPCALAAARLNLRSRTPASDDLLYRVISPEREGDPKAARIVVGTSETAPAFWLVERLGVHAREQVPGVKSFYWQDQDFSARDDALIATFEDPERPGLPLTLYYGNDLAIVARYIGDLRPGWKPWVRFFRGGELVLSAPLSTKGDIQAQRLDRPGTRRLALSAQFVDLPKNDLGLRGRASIDLAPEIVSGFLRLTNAARENVRAWAAPGARAPELVLFLYARPDELALVAGTDDVAMRNPVSGAVHALCAPLLPHDGGAAAARASAEALLGTAVEPWIADGAAVAASNWWWNGALDRWIAWLATSGERPSIEALVDPRACERLSPHCLVPLRAALFRCVREDRGDAFMRQLWRGTDRLLIDAELEKQFDAWLGRLATPYRLPLEARRHERRALFAHAPWLKGAGIEEPVPAHAGGFASERFEVGLGAVRALGANTVALASHLAAEQDLPAQPGLGSERSFGPVGGDLRLVCALQMAERRGLRTMLQADLTSAPGGTWSGSWSRTTREGWSEYFDDYARFATHYGLLAELAECDLLSVGSDIVQTTRATAQGRRARAEESAWRSAGWSQVIRAARGAFSGALTYGAGSLDEASHITFWSELDAVGLVLFEPVDTRGLSLLQARAALAGRIAHDLDFLGEVALREQKPALLVQVGFTGGVPAAWLARSGPGSTDADLEALQLDVLGDAVAASQAKVRGMFLWRFSTDPADRGINARDYVLQGVRVHEAVARVFGKF